MDRNTVRNVPGPQLGSVALLAEGVDRNTAALKDKLDGIASPSSRRAWIEITPTALPRWTATVALLAEGADRDRFVAVVSSTEPSESICRPRE